MKTFFSITAFLFTIPTWSQINANTAKPSDTLDPNAFINTVEQSLQFYIAEHLKDPNYDSLVKALNYAPNDLPEFSDAVYCQRIEAINELSPFHLDCNDITLSTIKYFVKNRRSFTSIVLGRSALYFDLFEETLSEYGLPLELKYLAVIESGLRPQVKSKAGALGLWQFMYATGQSYGLIENSYIDQRMDPVAATNAACRFLKKLYGIYGDWNLALAAYNAGPGNVNKAIRRSGNKTSYWEIRPFLPTETQSYVPNFIAATYMLNYFAEHNIVPAEAKIHYQQIDTMCLSAGIHMNTISKLVEWPIEEIQALNPVYKTTYIPKTSPPQCISGPLEKIGLLVSIEEDMYMTELKAYNPVLAAQMEKDKDTTPVALETLYLDTTNISDTANLEGYIYHKVKSGETLTAISKKYTVTIDDILDWNDLRTTNIYVGQRLLLKATLPKTTTNTTASATTTTAKTTPTKTTVTKKYYTVKSGDTFSKIASKYGLSQSKLSKLNPGININKIKVGQKIRVK
jgi:membrane-bound lytic murein transglycosylase D